MDFWRLLIETVVLLTACLVFGGLLSRVGQNAIVGYLLAGMLLAVPGGSFLIRRGEDVAAISELGVSLLLFGLGLEFSWQRLKHLGGRAMASGVFQVLFTGILAALAVLLFRRTLVESIAIGAIVSLSSTACVFRVLIDRGEIDSLHGRHSIAILLVQDVAVIPLAIVVGLLSGSGGFSEIVSDVGRILLLAAAIVAGLFLVLNKVIVQALGSLTLEQNREFGVLLATVIGLGSAWIAHKAGLSPALGAFIAGMFLGSSAFATQIRADVSSMRVVLLALFFGSVGMSADLMWILSNWQFVLGVAAAIVVGKSLVVWLVLRMVGRPDAIAVPTALCLAQVGEFAFVLGSIAEKGGVVGERVHMLIISSAIVTLFLTPYLVSGAPRVAIWIDTFRRQTPQDRGTGDVVSEESAPEVIIIGFGPAGQLVGRSLMESGTRVLVLDLNADAKQLAETMGFVGHIGDAQQIDILEHADVRRAEVVVITVPARSAALTVLRQVRTLAPNAHIIVRSRYQLHRHEFELAGAHAVKGDEEEVGRRLSEYVAAYVHGRRETASESDDSPI